MSFSNSDTIPAPPPKGPGKIKFKGEKNFDEAVKEAVEDYFTKNGLSKRDQPRQYVKAGMFFLWLVVSYLCTISFIDSWWYAIVCGANITLAMVGIAFCLQHDGNHKAFSDKKWVNKMMAMTLDLLGGSSYNWDHKHNTVHHTFVNIHDHDDDIEMGFLGRLAPDQPWYWFHVAQHIYLWFLYGFVVMKWHFFDDIKTVIRGRITSYKFPRPRGMNLVVFVGGKLIFATFAFLIPFCIYQSLWVFVMYLAISWSMGIIIAVVFQLAHVVEETSFPKPTDVERGHMETSLATHQVITTMDFARKYALFSWFVGGLNYQIEHHLFPRIAHVHYPKIAPIVERVCLEYDLPYHVHRGIAEPLRSHYRWLKKMGQQPAVS